MKTAFSFRHVGDVGLAIFGERRIDTATAVDLAFDLAAGKDAKPKILLDFGQVKAVESVAVRQMEARTRRVAEVGGEVRMINISRIENPQTMTQLALICPLNQTEVEAIRSFR